MYTHFATPSNSISSDHNYRCKLSHRALSVAQAGLCPLIWTSGFKNRPIFRASKNFMETNVVGDGRSCVLLGAMI